MVLKRTGLRMSLPATLVVVLACTVGEAQPGPRAPAAGEAADTAEVGATAADTAAAPSPDTVGRAPGADTVGSEGYGDEYRAMDLLIQAQLAYEAARPEAALTLADRVLMEFPSSGAVEPARWVGARAAFAMGRYALARELALEYANGQPSSSTLAARARELARLAEDGMGTPAAAAPVIGVILPRTGPRVLVQWADRVLEGIELAVSEAEGRQGRPIELVVVDDSGGARTRGAVAELERRGALAIIGPLLPRELPLAADARLDARMLVVSPTAGRHPVAPTTYTVSGADGRGAQLLGQYAADVGLRQAAVLYERSPEYERKAEAFAIEYRTLGGEVKASVPYDSGTTTFGPHMTRILLAVAPPDTTTIDTLLLDSLVTFGYLPDRMAADTMARDSLLMLADSLAAVVALMDTAGADTLAMPADSGLPYDTSDPWLGQLPQQPFALFVAAPQQDVPKIAPQVAFYDLDSAGVQVFGDEAWATAGVRRVTPARDLEGVITASRFPPERADDIADPAFVELYETTYRRSLDNPLPALGYDAASLVLHALPNRILTTDALARRFTFLTGIRGATGVLSVRAGQVVRTPFLVEIIQGGLRPAPYPWQYLLPVPMPPTPPEPDTTVADDEEGETEGSGG